MGLTDPVICHPKPDFDKQFSREARHAFEMKKNSFVNSFPYWDSLNMSTY